jgi:transposase
MLPPGPEVTVIVGIDAHKRFHVAALVDERGTELGWLEFPNSAAGAERLRGWLREHGADAALIGVEGAAHYGRQLCLALGAAGHEVLDVPPWRTRRERPRHGPGKTDAGDAMAIAHVVRRARAALGPALAPELVRALALLELGRRQAVGDRTQAIQRVRSLWLTMEPEAEREVVYCHRQKVLGRLKRISFGPGVAAEAAARCLRELARDVERLNARIAAFDEELAALLARHGNPVADLHGAGPTVAAALIAQAGDVRRFRSAAAFARFSGTAPIPCGSGQTAGRHRLHRGGNRQLNAALYRIALVQARDDPTAQRYLARKQAEGKTKREARRALQRHLANVVYRRLRAWAETALGANTA